MTLVYKDIARGGWGFRVQFFLRYCQGVVGVEKGARCNFFLEFDTIIYFKFKNTSNLIFLNFKVPSESFFHKDFKTSLTF